MKLEEFLKEVGGKEEDIISCSEQESLAAVQQDGYALRHVHKDAFKL